MNLDAALARMPHRGAMLLLAEVVEVDAATIRCRACDHRAADYPLRVRGELPTAALVELGAQAAAAHASLFGVAGHHVGLLLSLHDVEVAAGRADDVTPPLIVETARLEATPAAARYRFRVVAGERALVAGDALMSISKASS